MKKKILISMMLVVPAAAAGIAPSLMLSTSVQSNNIDVNNPVDPTNPTNPVDPVDPTNPTNPTDPVDPVDPTNPTNPTDPVDPVENISYLPKSLIDFFTYDIKYSYYEAPDKTGFNDCLKNLFSSLKIEDYLENKDEYQNVSISYVDNSGDLDQKTFSISVTPTEGFEWEDKSTNPKTVTVFIQKLTTELLEPVKELAYLPKLLNDFFTYDIKYSGTQDNTGLNGYLKNLFSSLKFEDYLENKDEYKNVSFSFVNNSANWTDKSFKISVAPTEGSEWEDKSTNSKTVTVVLQKFSVATIQDATAPTKAKINQAISERLTILSDKDLGDAISYNLSKKLITMSANDNTSTNFLNVNVAYVQNSASIKNKNFKLNIVPANGHSWKDTNTTEIRTIVVDIPQLDWAGNSNWILFDLGYQSNIVINTSYSYSEYPTGKDYTYTIAEDKYPKLFGTTVDNIKSKIFETCILDFKKVFSIEPVSTYKNAFWYSTALSFSRYVTEFFFKADVKPTAGYTWLDGGTYAKNIQFSFWACNTKYCPVTLGTTSDINQLPNEVDKNYDANGLPNRYISFVGPNQKLSFEQQKIRELDTLYQPWYTSTITNLKSATGKNNVREPWTFDIQLTNVVNPSITKSIKGWALSVY